MSCQIHFPIRLRCGRFPGGSAAAALAVALALALGADAADDSIVEQVRKASVAYAEAYNKKDYKALADQWAVNAELLEGGSRLEGREAIVASIRVWRERHPEATLQIVVGDVVVLAEPLARVSGVMRFTRRPGDKPVESRFASLRVLEGGTWRLAESLVAPAHAAALDELDWMLGTWRSEGTDGPAVEAIYEKTVGGYCILGRTKIKPKAGPTLEAVDVIHADRDSGLVRCWVFDSTGARAEGVFEADGSTINRSMVGTPSDSVSGRTSRWVQVIVPGGDSHCTMHAIERSIDGVPLPDDTWAAIVETARSVGLDERRIQQATM
jgi:hypothetical protein